MTDAVCTGCDSFLYTEDSGPCPNCFPGLERTTTGRNEMAVLEAREYGEAQRALAADPIMVNMAGGLKGVAREELVHEDGGIRYEFMVAAMREYQARGGKVASYGMGDYGKALMLLLDGKAGG